MSRIGKRPVDIPGGVKVAVAGQTVSVQGPNGNLSQEVHRAIKVKVDGGANKIVVERSSDTKQDKALHGLTRALIANMVVGVTAGYEKKLDIIGVGYNAKLQGKELRLQVGFANPVIMPIPEGIKADLPNPTNIVLKSADKQLIGQFAAEIRRVRPPEPYNSKGIKYTDEVVRRKAGKTFVSGES
ncbi:MAG: 50S ribosomal protein L6 [Planctomycetes bacterium]|nr:50S ribosomal protein L6 [Planctomycetota bacterium]MBI3846656.1 50S ribosomal protein L6 [Planctomycetota bacterium]